ncbi:hypothetical protein [Pseudoclavibacter helvolus]|uniref:hypothetical protein n=1 Tax=Pseudoclavibacter helvolus TaxID=255205 RepID=UPI0024ACD097|nr:hypothetical protein [Pseudoclavibacter helvolus]
MTDRVLRPVTAEIKPWIWPDDTSTPALRITAGGRNIAIPVESAREIADALHDFADTYGGTHDR